MSIDLVLQASPRADAYGRVTNAERFRPLHALAARLIDDLVARYDVARSAAFESPPDMRPFEHELAPVTVTPTDSMAAPLSFAFTKFPSVVVRFGHWIVDSFPACGCDACAETADREALRLEQLLSDVTAGRFYEEISIPWLGRARLRWSLGAPAVGRLAEGCTALPRARARAMRANSESHIQWHAWPERQARAIG